MPNIFDRRFGSYKHTQKLKIVSETTNHKLEVPYYDKCYVTMEWGWEKGIYTVDMEHRLEWRTCLFGVQKGEILFALS